MTTTTTSTSVPTYNPKVVNRLDRVMLVLAILVSAIVVLTGASANQNAIAASGAPALFQVMQSGGTLDAGVMNAGVGGSLASAPASNAGEGLSSQGGVLNP